MNKFEKIYACLIGFIGGIFGWTNTPALLDIHTDQLVHWLWTGTCAVITGALSLIGKMLVQKLFKFLKELIIKFHNKKNINGANNDEPGQHN